jgi:hypothetical protein
MKQKPWNQPFPLEIVLGGINRFSDPHWDPVQSWVISPGTGLASDFSVRCRIQDSAETLTLLSTFSEPSIESSNQWHRSQPPVLNFMDWDWIDYHYEPLEDLQVSVINWIPDLRVACGTYHIHNTGPKKREIQLKLNCHGERRKQGFRFSRKSFQGRNIISGSSNSATTVLFMPSSEYSPDEPTNQLGWEMILESGAGTELRWILACCGPESDANRLLEQVLQLDWQGEIGRRKVTLSNRLQIYTGSPERDFTLASSQRLARLHLNQVILKSETENPDYLPLDPLQCWQLIQALEPLDSSNLERLLRSALRRDKRLDQSSPLAVTLLWHSHQVGIDSDVLNDLLSIAAEYLASWFSEAKDKDGDGIPEGSWGNPFQGDQPLRQDQPIIHYSDMKDSHLETPGLASLLHHELNHLGKLIEILDSTTPPADLIQRSRILKEFLLDAWQDPQSRFQSRHYLTHLSVEGFSLPDGIRNGWNEIGEQLPHPAQLWLRILGTRMALQSSGLSITLHGTDWLGRYRVEELTAQEILWDDSGGWCSTRSIFSHLDHCNVRGLKNSQNIIIKSPGSDQHDLRDTLPLWVDDLDDEIMSKMISRSLGESGKFWSKFGFIFHPQAEKSIQLPLNLLVCQGLLSSGEYNLAGKVFKGWLDAAITNLQKTGKLYPAWDPRTGSGLGKENLVTSLIPIGQLLDLLAIRFPINGGLILEERNPALFPVTLAYKGVEISIDEKKTTLSRSGEDDREFYRGTEVIIPF